MKDIKQRKAVAVLGRIARRYPIGTASLFEGAGIEGSPNGQSLAAALKSRRITPGQLYERTYGSAFSAWSDFNPMANIKAAELVAGANPQVQQNQENKTKFEQILNTLLGGAGQAVDLYAKAKTAGQPQPPADYMAADAKGKLPWPLIAGAGALVIILVIVLVFMRKK